MSPAAHALASARPPRTARAFALPLVVILTMVAALMIAMMLERHGTQRLAVQREIDGYQTFHGSRGIREAVMLWMTDAKRGPITAALDRSNKAFDLDLADGSVASVYLFDGQGKALGETSSLTGDDLQTAEGILSALHDAPAKPASRGPRSNRGAAAPPNAPPGDDGLHPFTRSVGPLTVSALSAPPEVLTAVLSYVSGGANVSSLVREIQDLRDGGALNQAALASVLSKDDLKPDQRGLADRLLTVEPGLWWLVVEVQTPDGVLVARWGGHYAIEGTGGVTAKVGAWEQMGSFLTWDELSLP
jgi:hypothetical protein